MMREPLNTSPERFAFPPDAITWMEPRCEDVLCTLGLDSFDKVIDCRIGELLTVHPTRRALKLAPPESTNGPALFLKVFRKTQRKDSLGSVLHRKRPRSKARLEWDALVEFTRAGLNVPRAVALGVRRKGLAVRESFLILEGITDGRPLSDLFRQWEGRTDPPRKSAVLDAIADTTRRIHDAGLVHPDLYSKHVLVGNGSPPEVFLLDVQRSRRYRRLTRARLVRDLAALNVTLPWRAVSRADRWRFMLRYARGRLDRTATRRLANAVEARSTRMARRPKFRKIDWHSPWLGVALPRRLQLVHKRKERGAR